MMGQNRIVQYGSIGLLGLVVLVVVLRSGRETRTVEQPLRVGGGEALAPEAAEALGLEGDTESDTVRTLIAEIKQLKEETGQLTSDNKTLRLNNADLRNMESRIGQGVEANIEATRNRVESQLNVQVQNLQRKLRDMESRARQMQRAQREQTSASAAGYGAELSSSRGVTEMVTWVQPLGGAAVVGNGAGGDTGVAGFLDTARNKGNDTLALGRLTGRKSTAYGDTVQTPRPVYTIPKNATLVNSTALTALVGRVPLGGQVTDPYLFKVIIGRDNLAANGIEVPGVSYSVASGKAVGDWTLGCVRGTLYSMTFVFEDGTIRTVPKAEGVYEGGKASEDIAIGELSDDLGNPCVVGQRVTNAYSYLAQRIGVVGAAAAAEAAAASQTTQTTSVGGGGVSTTTTIEGSTGEYVLGRTISDGTMEVARWLDARQAQQFDAIYVQPGASVSIHITEQIDIDYEPSGRKTIYAGLGQGAYRALD